MCCVDFPSRSVISCRNKLGSLCRMWFTVGGNRHVKIIRPTSWPCEWSLNTVM